jgi:cytochrome oxidase Cu insertion factor (SCO1/SenC/PrrC family)
VKVLAALLLVVAAAGCGGSDEAATTTAKPAVAARPAPDISGRTLDGKPLSLVDFRGRPVFVIVWSSW